MQKVPSLPLWVVFLINKIYIVAPKHHRRQLTAKVCGSESADILSSFPLFCVFRTLCSTTIQVHAFTLILEQNGCLQQYRVLWLLSMFIAPNSLWLKTFTAQYGCCLLHRMPFLILYTCAHSLIPRLKTMVTSPGVRLVHTGNTCSAPTSKNGWYGIFLW